MSTTLFFWWWGGYFALLLLSAFSGWDWAAYLWFAWVMAMILGSTVYPDKDSRDWKAAAWERELRRRMDRMLATQQAEREARERRWAQPV